MHRRMILSLVALVLAGILSFGGINPISTGPSQLVFWFFAILVTVSVVGRFLRSNQTRPPFMQRWLDWEELKACTEKPASSSAMMTVAGHVESVNDDERVNPPG